MPQKTRRLGAGTVLGSGTVSNQGREAGHACIAEIRAIETVEEGKPATPYLKFGDRVRIEMFDPGGQSIFGAIDQQGRALRHAALKAVALADGHGC